MTDAECVRFLQWALPQLQMRWKGFRKVRSQVCKRLGRRMAELGLTDLHAYRAFLQRHDEEWAELDAMCRITISRFGRDKALWRQLVDTVLPSAAATAASEGRDTIAAWSAGCCGGEEPYSLAIAWLLEVAPDYPGMQLLILATDIDPVQLERARAACYAAATLRELPDEWRDRAFELRGDRYCLRPRFREPVTFAVHDIRDPPPATDFDLVLCRNLAFTYFDDELQHTIADHLRNTLTPRGLLIIGGHEHLPETTMSWRETTRAVFRPGHRGHRG